MYIHSNIKFICNELLFLKSKILYLKVAGSEFQAFIIHNLLFKNNKELF